MLEENEVKCSCTWGDGPDVLISYRLNEAVLKRNPHLDGRQWNFLDLTYAQAIELSIKLRQAAEQCGELERLIEQHELNHTMADPNFPDSIREGHNPL